MADKTIVQKLVIKPGYRVLLVNAPDGYETTLGDLPDGATIVTDPEPPVDLIQFFVTSRVALETQLAALKNALKPNGVLWISWPKGTSKVATDINRDSIAAYALSIGLRPVASIAVDQTWSALRFKIVG